MAEESPSASNPLGLDAFSSCGVSNILPDTASQPPVPNGCCVESVNGQTGVVVLTTTNIEEGTRKYFTNIRVLAALSALSPLKLTPTGPDPIGVLTHEPSGVIPGTYGSNTQYPVFTVDDKGHITVIDVRDLPAGLANPIEEALEALTGTGYLVKTGPEDTDWALKKIGGSSGRINVLNGDPLAAETSIDLAKILPATNTYGSSTQVPRITVDQYGRVTAISLVTITGSGGGSGATTLGGLTNVNDGADAPVNLLEILKWNGTEWISGPAGFVKYKGTWNATTNVITSTDVAINGTAIPAASAVNEGWYFVVATGGSTVIDGEPTWVAKDWIVSTGATWKRLSSGTSAPLITVTKSAADTLISGNSLVPGQQYKITGVDTGLYGGTDIYIKADTTNKFEIRGHGVFYNPKYTSFPIYTVAVVAKAIWGGKHWTNVNGLAGASTSDFTLNSEWAVVAFDATEYNQVVNDIRYDYANNQIICREDTSGSKVDGNSAIKNYQWGNTTIVNSNTLSGSSIDCINYRGPALSTLVLYNSTITKPGLLSIRNSRFSNSTYDFTASGTLSGKVIQNLESGGIQVTVDLSPSAVLFTAFSKKVWKMPNGDPILSYVNNAGCFVTGTLDDSVLDPGTGGVLRGAAILVEVKAGSGAAIAAGVIVGATTYSNNAMAGFQIEVTKGEGQPIPNIDMGDGTDWASKSLGSNTVTFAFPILINQYIKVKLS